MNFNIQSERQIVLEPRISQLKHYENISYLLKKHLQDISLEYFLILKEASILHYFESFIIEADKNLRRLTAFIQNNFQQYCIHSV